MEKRTKTALVLLFLCFFTFSLFAQNYNNEFVAHGGEYAIGKNDANNPCITLQQYETIQKRCNENIKLLKLDKRKDKTLSNVLFNWPLQSANGLNSCSYYSIYNYVDHDPTSGLQDWNCGTTTYDGHRGTDIVNAPYAFYMMDNNQVEVIAAAPGTIIDRADGNFDKNCATNNLTANYVIIQHADGSVALYWHMKKNSVTSKTIGQTVVTGEYLGVVGSSGNSTAPHLHFEVWSTSSSANLIDPYSGPCNNFNASSWWITQKPYTEPAIIKASLHTILPIFPGCPQTETPNEDSCFSPGENIRAAIFFRNETTGTSANLRIANPDGTTYVSWIHNCTSNYLTSWWWWYKTLPATAGTYTYEATYNGVTCTKKFYIVDAKITASGSTNICQGDSVTLTAGAGISYLWSNGASTQSIIVKSSGSFTVNVTNANGCSATSAPTVVTVNQLPIATITSNGSTSLCQGDSVTLTASVGNSYLWNNGATTQSIVVKNSGSYSVTVTNANGCSATSSPTIVTMSQAPIATITPGGPTTFCQGDSVLLTSSLANSYLWSNGATSQNIIVKTSGNYYVKVTNANGCSANSSTTTVTVNTLPIATITLSGSTTFCRGDSVTLTVDIIGTYLWNNGATTQSINVLNSGNYFVKVTNAIGCSATSSTMTITVNPLPASPSCNDTSVVSGTIAHLTATATPDVTFKWYDAVTNGNLLFTGNTFTTSAITQAITYYVESEDNTTKCRSARKAVLVKLIGTGTLNINLINNNETICSGQSVRIGLNGAMTDGKAPYTYNWQPATGLSSSTDSIVTASPGTTTKYTLTVTDSNGTKGTADVTVTVEPLPGTPTCKDTSIISGTFAILKPTALANATFLWYDSLTNGNLLFTGNVFNTPALSQATTYYVESEDNTTKCRSARKAVSITIKKVAVNESEKSSIIQYDKTFTITSLYPNPASDKLVLIIESKDEEKIEINIYNTLGQIVLSGSINLGNGTNTKFIDVNKQLPFGLYTIIVNNLNGYDSKSVLIAK
ncbi:MAG: peptidoglycan DD-metalloendopeptidase family protein [FCB group bacterium]|jgi:hypothetical protein